MYALTNLKTGACSFLFLSKKLKNAFTCKQWYHVCKNSKTVASSTTMPATCHSVLWVALTHQDYTWSLFGPKFLGARDFQLYLHLTYTIWGRVLFLTRCCLQYGLRAHQVSTRNTDNAPSLRKVLWEGGLMSHFVRTSLHCWLTHRGGDTIPTNLNGLHVAKCARPR